MVSPWLLRHWNREFDKIITGNYHLFITELFFLPLHRPKPKSRALGTQRSTPWIFGGFSVRVLQDCPHSGVIMARCGAPAVSTQTSLKALSPWVEIWMVVWLEVLLVQVRADRVGSWCHVLRAPPAMCWLSCCWSFCPIGMQAAGPPPCCSASAPAAAVFAEPVLPFAIRVAMLQPLMKSSWKPAMLCVVS